MQGLTEAERTAIGTPELWSSKDHIVHKTYWRRDFVQKLKAILQHQEIRPNEEDEEQLNSLNFEENRLRPWSEIYAESERLLEPDRAGVGGGGVEHRRLTALPDLPRHRAHQSRRQALSSVGGVGADRADLGPAGWSRSPAIATSTPSCRRPR